jgi:hypothetical protein
MRLTDEAQGAVEFGRFRLLPHRGELHADFLTLSGSWRAIPECRVLTLAKRAHRLAG